MEIPTEYFPDEDYLSVESCQVSKRFKEIVDDCQAFQCLPKVHTSMKPEQER